MIEPHKLKIQIPLNSITTLYEANTYLRNIYGETAELQEVTVGKKIKYRFVNVHPMRNYPNYLRSVQSAINTLIAHESGWVAHANQQKRLKRSAKSSGQSVKS